MIIKCGKCETKFRFEESIIQGDGVWVRCSRCENVFFQDNPTQAEQKAYQTEENRADSAPEVVKPVLSREEEISEAMKEDLGMAVKEFDALEDPAEEQSLDTEETQAPTKEKRNKKSIVGKFFAYIFLIHFIVLLLAGIYLWAVPEDRREFMGFLATYVPILEKVSGEHRLHSQVTLNDVKQHFVNNWLMGNLRVLEGTAVNSVDYSLTRIQVRGRLYDARGGVIGERVSFCGNLLTDAELTTLTEEEIQKKLSQPLGSNATISNDRVKPNGRIPFMIVFSHEPSVVARATVMVAGAEKLLE